MLAIFDQHTRRLILLMVSGTKLGYLVVLTVRGKTVSAGIDHSEEKD